MSTNDLRGAGAHQERSAETADGANGDRRRLILVGAVGGVAVVAALGYFVVAPALSGGSNDSSTASVAAPATRAHVKATPSASATPTATSVPTASAVLVAGRDPFKPLLTEAPPSPAAPTASSSTTATPSPSASAGASDSASATPTAAPSAAVTPAAGS